MAGGNRRSGTTDVSDGITPAVQMPVPMGVIAETGDIHPPLSETRHPRSWNRIPPALLSRAGGARSLDGTVDDPMDLNQTGWCVVFASDADPAIKEALQPLLDLRRSQIANEKFFKVFEGPHGVRPSQSPSAWAAIQGRLARGAQSVPAKASPTTCSSSGRRAGFRSSSRHSSICSGPSDGSRSTPWTATRRTPDISSTTNWARRRCAGKRTAVWIPRNPLDMATPMLAGSVVPEFLGQLNADDQPVGKAGGFDISTFVGDGQATKATAARDFHRHD